MDYRKVDLGFADLKLKDAKISKRQTLEFRMEAKACLVAILKKMLEKCSVSY